MRVALAIRMGLREQRRRPLLIALLTLLPFFFITRAIAVTLPTPRPITLPNGAIEVVTMRELHGASMAAITVGFLAGLCGQFVMRSAAQADRRLVVAGFRPGETIAARMTVLLTATALVLTVSLLVTAMSFTPSSWPVFALGTLLIGLTFGGIGALAGSTFGALGATYLMLFLPMMDVGTAQNPMFGDGSPGGWATALPGYGSMRVLIDGAFSDGFHAAGPLALAAAWLVAIGAAVVLVLERSLGVRR